MENSKLTCPEFIEVLASNEPVPGGGGAAALAGAIGIALGNMVGSLTVGKKKYADVEDEIIELKERCDRLQSEFLELIDMDAEAFAPLAAVYKMPKDTDEEKVKRAEALEKCSVDACKVPLKIMEKCCEAIDIIRVIAAKGSRLAVSDAGCAAALVKSALLAASLNVFINTKSMKSRDTADKLNKKACEMIEIYSLKADNIFNSVKSELLV